MNIRSITMGQALETLAQQSRIVPTLIFRGRASESVSSRSSYEMGEYSEPVMEPEVMLVPQQDEEDNFSDRFLQKRTAR